MKTSIRAIVSMTLMILLPWTSDAGRRNGDALNLATFNIRYGTSKDTGARSWDSRKTACAACIRDYDFDVVGIQEALEHQQEDMREMLPEYEFIFAGRNDGIKGEAVGVGYRKDRLKALESGRFWMSPTPDEPSNAQAWGGPKRHRIAVWVKFEDLKTGKRFYFLSTHLEVGKAHAGVRAESADLIIRKEKVLNKEGLPFFVAGDLNPGSQSEEMLLRLRRYFDDSFHLAYDAGTLRGPAGTYNGFNPDADLGSHSKRGDYIFCKGAYKLKSYEALTKKYDGQYPSDHLAVVIAVIM